MSVTRETCQSPLVFSPREKNNGDLTRTGVTARSPIGMGLMVANLIHSVETRAVIGGDLPLSSRVREALTLQQGEELHAKVAIEDRVDQRIDRGSDVAEPDETVQESRSDGTAFAHAVKEIQDAEGKPSDDEDHENHPEDFHCLAFVANGRGTRPGQSQSREQC